MKNILLTLMLLACGFTASFAQKTKGEPIKESDVPKVVKDAHDNTIGYPAEQWIKLNLSNGPRYVAVVQQMHQTSAKMLQHRYRYNAQGQATSMSQYRGTSETAVYLGSDDNPALENKVAKLIGDNTLVSFEGFFFTPGAQAGQNITAHRLVLTDKTGKHKVVYLDTNGKEIDMSKYPIRKLEAEEIDPV